MDELSLEQILTEDQMSEYFGIDENSQEENNPNPSSEEGEEKKTKEGNGTVEVDTDNLFEESPESVGSEEQEEQEGTPSTEEGSSPTNLYSSIANALVEDGIFQNLTDEQISEIKSAEDFAKVFSDQQAANLDERQKRIEEALNYNVEPTEIQKHEKLLSFLDSIDDKAIENEEEAGENLRKNIIYQDYINRGFSKERALKEVDRSVKAGTDIEDAKEALISNKEYFAKSYKDVVAAARKEQEKIEQAAAQEAADLRKAIVEEDIAFGDLNIDRITKQKVLDNVMKPTYKDPDTGERLTAIQRYSKEHRVDFLKNLGLIYTLTDGFTNLDKLVGSKVKKEIKKGLRNLESTINSTARNQDGSLNFLSGTKDPESKSMKWNLDI